MKLLPLPEGVKLATFTKEKLNALWERLAPFDNLFADDNMKDPEVFQRSILNPKTVCLETDFGIMTINRLIPGLRGEVHFAFWDLKLSVHTELMKDCMVWAFLSFELERMETFVADYARTVQRFIEKKLGFRYEGTLRRRVRHNGQLIDMIMYSVLKSEVL